MSTQKPGYKTSEFYVTLASFVFSGLFLMGVFTEKDQADELSNIAAHGVESCILIGGQLFILYRYIAGRNKVKAIRASTETSQQIVEKKTNGRKPAKLKSTKTTKPRTTKARNPKPD